MKKSGSDVAPASDRSGRPQEAPSPWRTIDSAPKDAYAKVLGWCVFLAGAECRLVQRNHDGAWIAFGVSQNVTHWMPLPDGPTAQDETGGDESTRGVLRGLAGWLQAKADVEMQQPAGLSVRDAALINGRIDAYREVRDQIIATIKAPAESDRSRDEHPSPDTSALLAEAEGEASFLEQNHFTYTPKLLRRLSQALREARG